MTIVLIHQVLIKLIIKTVIEMEVSKALIYLDYNATTPLAEEVVKGISHSLTADWGNPSSGNPFGVKGKSAIGKAREHIANMLDCFPNEVIFTSGGTEANNMIIRSAVQYYKECVDANKGLSEKPHIITTNVEHDSVILPIKHLETEGVATCSVVEVNKKGCINIEDIISKITPQTCLITIMYANNETGVIMPISEIGSEITKVNAKREKLKLPKILYHTDAAQVIGKEKISFYASNVDYLTVVGHKFYGPRIGCICARERIFPLLFGGGQESGLRPGTENTPMIVGLGVAAELVSSNIEKYTAHMLECREKLERRLKEVFGNEIVVNCRDSKRLPNTCNVSFREKGLEGFLILSVCKRVVASVGAACHGDGCSQVLINSGVPVELARNAIRLSVGRNTTIQDVEDAVSDLEFAVKTVKSISVNV